MRVFLQVWNENGRVDSYGPYDGTDCARAMRDAQYWCRTICQAGGVKTCWIMLGNEYDHLTSREAIVEYIDANGYEFDENGKLA